MTASKARQTGRPTVRLSRSEPPRWSGGYFPGSALRLSSGTSCPLHPHEEDDPLTNRCHSRAERDATWPFLTALIAMVAPRRIVAIGRDAGLALAGIDIPVTGVRHPSYGGQAEFIAGVHAIYGVDDDARK
jgi:hypothetical protein